MLEARHRHLQDGAYALRRQAFDDIGAHPRGHGVAHMGGVGVVGEQHDGAALVARGHDHMFKRVAGFAFGVDNDQIGAQLGDALAEKHIGGQRGNDVILRFEQPQAQRARAFELQAHMLFLLVQQGQIRNNDHDAQGMAHGMAQARKMPFCAEAGPARAVQVVRSWFDGAAGSTGKPFMVSLSNHERPVLKMAAR